MGKKTNRLINEKSPYLLQHAYNPVDWFPWCEEAFEKAREENKPVFLSIGYSTCHWCHVMEQESFEDNSVADILNMHYVSIKVDREERPDIDHIYMAVCQAMNGAGGWPLTVFLTPDKKPFFAATYIPRESGYGRTGLLELLPNIARIFRKQKDEIAETTEQIMYYLAQDLTGSEGSREIVSDDLRAAFDQAASQFDSNFGGFGESPKFPSPHNLLFLLRYYHISGQREALDMVEKTLDAMRLGGIYDHIGKGFHRYATDREWLLPHFEKMLYDQAMLILAYTEAWQVLKKESYKKTVYECVDYIEKKLSSENGAFFSAEDADSEGEEGKFYLWTLDEIQQILKEDAGLIIDTFRIESHGNFSDPFKGGKTGENILYLDLHKPVSESKERKKIDALLEQLYNEREKRPHPHLDDKILTDWNGLMIAALARAGRVFNNVTFRYMAERAAKWILNNLRTSENRLLHRYRSGSAGINANVDDYAFLIWGLLELTEATFDYRYLREALALQKVQDSDFYDPESGGYYFTSEKTSDLIVRKKEFYDGAIPSGNSVSALNLIRLSAMIGDTQYQKRAMELLETAGGFIRRSPFAFSHYLSAAAYLLGDSYEIIIAGKREDERTEAMLQALHNEYLPNSVILFHNPQRNDDLVSIAPYVKSYEGAIDGTAVYVCRNFTCDLPVTSAEEMFALLNKGK